MNPHGSPYVNHYDNLHFLFHPFIPTLNPKPYTSFFFPIHSQLTKGKLTEHEVFNPCFADHASGVSARVCRVQGLVLRD